MTSQQEPLWGEVKAPRLSESAQPDQCRKCGSAIWSGYCRTGFKTHLRVFPITPAEELEFYVLRRATYKLWRVVDRFEFQLRLPQDLLTANDDIALTVHKCTDKFATDWPDYWPNHTRTFIPLNEEPPF